MTIPRPLAHAVRVVAILGALTAASATVSGEAATGVSRPIMAHLWSAADRAVRPLHGMPGSATMGAPIHPGVDVSNALVLTERHLLASMGDVPGLLLVDAGADPPVISRIPGITMTPARWAASSQGTAVAVYDTTSGQVAIVVGLPSAPRVASVIDAAQLGGSIDHLAVTDDGETLASATDGTGFVVVYRWTRSGGARVVLTSDSVRALAVGANGDIVVADPRRQEVIAVAAGGLGWHVLMHAGHGVSQPVGVAVSSSGDIHVADAGGGAVMTVDRTGRLLGSRRCACVITGMSRVGKDVYWLTDRVDRTVHLMDGRPSNPRIVFVPPPLAHE